MRRIMLSTFQKVGYRKYRYNTPTYKGCFCPMVDLEKAFFSDVEDLPVEEYSYVYGDEQ